jgi:hypothetical protein
MPRSEGDTAQKVSNVRDKTDKPVQEDDPHFVQQLRPFQFEAG